MAGLDRIDVGAVISAHPYVEVILSRLRRAGHDAVLIGGVVRDGLQLKMGRCVPFPPDDVDIATSALPEEIREVFSDRQIIGLGEEFGVLLIVGPHGRSYEVATFRVEGEYDGRWPRKVELVRDLAGDVRRRDLTINGLAATADGDVIDLVGGVADLAALRIRAIGDPMTRFAEDYLRILRAIRFACQIDGRIDDETAAAIAACAEKIRVISNERIGEEVIRILGSCRAAKGLALMDELGLLAPILPELTACKGIPQPEAYHPEGDVFVHTLAAVRVADAFVRDPIVKMAVVLHDIGKPDALRRSSGENMGGHCAIGARKARDVGRRLRLSRQDVFRLRDLVRHHMRIADFPQMGRGKQVRFVSEEEDRAKKSPRERFPFFFQLLQVLVADCEASAHRSSGWAPILRETLDVIEHIDLVCGLQRAREIVDGHALMALGVPPGPRLGSILSTLHDRILAGQIATRDEAIAEARELIAEHDGETYESP
jgi:tRNA nucleotidyltransferase/poly(A) polymerase